MHIQDRPALSNVFEHPKVKNHQSSKVDWGRILTDHIQEVTATLAKKIPYEATKEDKIRLLASMGIEIQSSQRIPENVLDNKLRSAIDAAQYFTGVFGEEKTPVNPATFPRWPLNSPQPLGRAVARHNLRESDMLRRTMADPARREENVFMGVRRVLVNIGEQFEKRHPHLLIQDDEETNFICIHVLEVRKIKDGVPMLVLLFGRGTRSLPLSTLLLWRDEAISMSPDQFIPTVTIGLDEQNLLLAILASNSQRFDGSVSAPRRESEQPFVTSFLLPMGPIGQQDIGKLTNYSGCYVCGKQTATCQRAHWKEHKPTCNSLKGGSWRPVKISTQNKGITSYYNMQTPIDALGNPTTQVISSGNPPPNAHGDSPFLIKIQRAMTDRPNPMLIYDRQRSLDVVLDHSVDPGSYEAALKQMPTGYRGLKIYRWAKRTGDWELTICFDKIPVKDPLW
ncbi:hypothetical protein VNI00_004156 [Paramarasmius palmivorus]|uniref:MYND-type domain-containing protein n=1 Tax=Paramarasmius palmivorus TaxID=297713 RepID=A0AAW0DNB6_9AGAR